MDNEKQSISENSLNSKQNVGYDQHASLFQIAVLPTLSLFYWK